MVHAFEFDGVYVALDVESGSVHIIDEIIYDILNGHDLEKYSDEDIKNAKEEMDTLKKPALRRVFLR